MVSRWKKFFVKDLARQRIDILFQRAEKIFHREPELSQKYVDLALKIARTARVRLPRKYKRRLCKYCKSYLWPGVNATVRLRTRRQPHVVIKCHVCGRITRIPYK
ncbi:MAG: ribonuclease P [Thermoprotei archaeon]|nr:MAG: ribonuclease P [Thermoprotei archaeon]